tara:strand:+ start:78 stop:311 length:234 start_codon:yes stop_codon:yes gene_type:complete
MFIQIAPRVKVFATDEQVRFILKHSNASFKSSQLPADEVQMAKTLADKAIFVRKKLDNDVQYALNKSIRFVRDGNKK